MILFPRQYVRFLDGRTSEPVVIVAFLPGELAANIPTLSTDVRLGRDYAQKIWRDHKLGYEDLGLIQTIIEQGWCTKSRPNNLDFLFVDESLSYPQHLILGLKSARNGQETWITTLYKANETEFRHRLKRAKRTETLIRDHS